MRRVIIFLILGLILGFMIYEYLNPERRRVQEVSPLSDRPGSERRSASHKGGQWQGTDDKQPVPPKDDLSLIHGIGPAFEKALNGIGIFTFAQLADQEAENLASKMTTRITPERIRRDRWIEQARERARTS